MSIEISGADVIAAVCDRYGVSAAELADKTRSRPIARPRQVAMWLCRELTDMSLQQIGAALGGRDHSTILHGIGLIELLRKNDAAVKAEVDAIADRLRAHRRAAVAGLRADFEARNRQIAEETAEG